MMKIEVWSDVACPFCYIGKRKLEHALEKFAHRDNIEVVYRSFELDPGAPIEASGDINDMLASKYGMSRADAEAANANLAAQAATVGVDFQYNAIKPTNTFDAHRLIHFAAQHGHMSKMKERLLRAYFTEGKNVGSKEELVNLAVEVGLDEAEAKDVVHSERYTDQVRANEAEARELGIQGVPFFVLDRKYAISGAQPDEVFANALDKAWEQYASTSGFTVVGEAAADNKTDKAAGSNDDDEGGMCSIDGYCAP